MLDKARKLTTEAFENIQLDYTCNTPMLLLKGISDLIITAQIATKRYNSYHAMEAGAYLEKFATQLIELTTFYSNGKEVDNAKIEIPNPIGERDSIPCTKEALADLSETIIDLLAGSPNVLEYALCMVIDTWICRVPSHDLFAKAQLSPVLTALRED